MFHEHPAMFALSLNNQQNINTAKFGTFLWSLRIVCVVIPSSDFVNFWVVDRLYATVMIFFHWLAGWLA